MRRALWTFTAFLFSLLASGCGEHVVGTKDVTLEYAYSAPLPKSASTNEELRAAVRRRLGASHIVADVDVIAPDRVRVLVDGDSVAEVDELLGWRGGIRLEVPDPAFVFAPSSVEGLTAKQGDGGERYFEGSRDAVLRAIRGTALDSGHRIDMQGVKGDVVRTVAMKSPPLADLTEEVADVTANGKNVEVHLTNDGAKKLFAAVDASKGEKVAVVRDHSILWLHAIDTEPAKDGHVRFIFPAGQDILAYARAERLEEMLDTPALPALERVSAVNEPPNWTLASLGLVLPMVLSFAWLFFVRRFDRARPEPMWLVLATFALGGLSVVPAAFAEWGLMSLSPYLNPSVMTLGGQFVAFPIALLVFTLTVGVSEEGSKFLGAWSLARHRREFDEPIDGIIYGAASALGFAALENVKYFAAGRVSGMIVISRAFMSVPGHMFFGAIWGYALGQKLVRPKTSLLLAFLLAATLHGAFDTFLSIKGMGLLAPLLNLCLASTFIVLLRRALRHGVVTKEAAAIDPASRTFFKVGSRSLFAIFAVGFHIVAFMVFALGVYMEVSHQRVGIPFIFFSSVLLVMLGVTAYGLSLAIPLDVVVDDYGVTFAGAVLPWREIASFDLRPVPIAIGRKKEIRLQGQSGAMNLGPGDPDVIDRLGRTLYDRLKARDHAKAPAV